MTNSDLTFHRKKLLALRARLLGDMTQMEDDSLKDHAKTISIPTDRKELGSDTADQELTLTLLKNDEKLLDQIEAALQRIEDGCYGRCDECGEDLLRVWMPSPMPQSAYDVLRTRKADTGSPACLASIGDRCLGCCHSGYGNPFRQA